MRCHRHFRLFRSLLLLVLAGYQLSLAACGSSASNSDGTPRGPVTATVPVPSPRAPVPAPAPPGPAQPASVFDTTEFRLNAGLALTNPTAAYARGITGRGVTVAILDTGLDIDSAEFTGRLAAGSGNFLPTGIFDDTDGHGTAVASVILGAKNDTGTHGVAYDATLFSGRILTNFLRNRTGNPSQAEVQQENVDFYNGFANGLNAARTAGAQAVNLSIGFASVTVSNPGSPPPPSAPLDAAVAQFNAATAAALRDGVVFVIAAGNDSAASPNSFPRQVFSAATLRAGEAPVLIVGALNTDGQTLASFSDRAGTGPEAQYYIAAPGVRIQAPDNTGTVLNFSGTSLAAPHVTGALALLLQAFPNLTGPKAADLLLSTATDLGDPGTDAIYGRGALNIGRAFQPQGSQRIATAGGAVALDQSRDMLTFSGATGGMAALRTALQDVVFQDSYDRVFHADLSARVNTLSAGRQPLAAATQSRALISSQYDDGHIAIAASAQRPFGGNIGRFPLTVQGFARVRLSPDVAIWISHGSRAEPTAAARLVESDILPQTAFAAFGANENSVASGMTFSTGAVDIGAQWQQGNAAPLIGTNAGSSRQSVAFFMRRTAAHTTWQADVQIARTKTVQGAAQSTRLFSAASAASTLGQLSVRHEAGALTLAATLQVAQTQAQTGTGLITGMSPLVTSAYAATATWRLSGRQSLALGLAQPRRVERGTLDLAIPTGFNYAANESSLSRTRLSLVPDRRELDVELGYRLLWRDTVQFRSGLYHRFNVDHRPGNDIGAHVGLRASF